MDEKARLSREDFAAACRDLFAERPGPSNDDLSLRALTGWRWQESPHMPGYGHLVRGPLDRLVSSSSVPVECEDPDGLLALEPCDPNEAGDEEDEAAVVVVSPPPSSSSPFASAQAVQVVLYAVYSDTYRVPSLYFTATFQSTGAPLDLQSLLHSNLFALAPTSRYPFTTLDRTDPPSPDGPVVIPFLTTAEHPVLGLPCWAVHPCNTADLLRDILGPGGEGAVPGKDYMRAWIMVVGSLVDLRDDAS